MTGYNRYKDDFDVYLLDLDGTLTDSAKGIINSIVYAFDKMGEKVPDMKTMNKFIGPPLNESFPMLCGFSEEKTKVAVDFYRERYSVIGLFENELYDDTKYFLEKLKENGKKIALATSKPEEFAIRIIKKLGIKEYFDVAVGSDTAGKYAKKWQVIDKALSDLKVTDKNRVIMIGDRRYDVEGAHKCGVKCIGVLHGYGSREEFEKARADFIEDNLTAIIVGGNFD